MSTSENTLKENFNLKWKLCHCYSVLVMISPLPHIQFYSRRSCGSPGGWCHCTNLLYSKELRLLCETLQAPSEFLWHKRYTTHNLKTLKKSVVALHTLYERVTCSETIELILKTQKYLGQTHHLPIINYKFHTMLMLQYFSSYWRRNDCTLLICADRKWY